MTMFQMIITRELIKTSLVMSLLTFAYNANGQAILSELGITTNNVGQGKIELDFQAGAQQ